MLLEEKAKALVKKAVYKALKEGFDFNQAQIEDDDIVIDLTEHFREMAIADHDIIDTYIPQSSCHDVNDCPDTNVILTKTYCSIYNLDYHYCTLKYLNTGVLNIEIDDTYFAQKIITNTYALTKNIVNKKLQFIKHINITYNNVVPVKNMSNSWLELNLCFLCSPIYFDLDLISKYISIHFKYPNNDTPVIRYNLVSDVIVSYNTLQKLYKWLFKDYTPETYHHIRFMINEIIPVIKGRRKYKFNHNNDNEMRNILFKPLKEGFDFNQAQIEDDDTDISSVLFTQIPETILKYTKLYRNDSAYNYCIQKNKDVYCIYKERNNLYKRQETLFNFKFNNGGLYFDADGGYYGATEILQILLKCYNELFGLKCEINCCFYFLSNMKLDIEMLEFMEKIKFTCDYPQKIISQEISFIYPEQKLLKYDEKEDINKIKELTIRFLNILYKNFGKNKVDTENSTIKYKDEEVQVIKTSLYSKYRGSNTNSNRVKIVDVEKSINEILNTEIES